MSILVFVSLIKALFVVCRIQKVTLYDSNHTNPFDVGLSKIKIFHPAEY